MYVWHSSEYVFFVEKDNLLKTGKQNCLLIVFQNHKKIFFITNVIFIRVNFINMMDQNEQEKLILKCFLSLFE